MDPPYTANKQMPFLPHEGRFYFIISYQTVSFNASCNSKYNKAFSGRVNDEFRDLLLIFANSLNPDQDRQNVGPDLDSNRLTH